LIKFIGCILFEKYIYILALEMASPGNQHCANCIGIRSFSMEVCLLVWVRVYNYRVCVWSYCWAVKERVGVLVKVYD